MVVNLLDLQEELDRKVKVLEQLADEAKANEEVKKRQALLAHQAAA